MTKISAIKRNCVSVSGKGHIPIVFAHGYGCGQEMWRFITPYFENNYKIILFDHVGNGHSDVSYYSKESYNSLESYADDVIEICDELKIRDVIFVGHSVSATVGVIAANKRSDIIDTLVLVGPSPCYLNIGDYRGGFEREDIAGLLEIINHNYTGWATLLSSMVLGPAAEQHITDELKESFCSVEPEIAKHFGEVMFYSDNRLDFQQVKSRTLILQCTDDAIAPIHIGKYINQSITDSKLFILRATGHCPHLTAPHETAEAINAFLIHQPRYAQRALQ